VDLLHQNMDQASSLFFFRKTSVDLLFDHFLDFFQFFVAEHGSIV
jgi:hypothetical protein